MWVQTGGRAGRQLSQRLTHCPPPPHPLPLPPTHTHSLTLAHGFSYLEDVAVCHSLFFANKACTSIVFFQIQNLDSSFIAFQKCGLKMLTKSRVICELPLMERSERVSPCNLCVFASRLQLEGERRAEGIWRRWQSGPAQTWRGEGTVCPAAHHQVHSCKSQPQWCQLWGT